MKTNLLTTTLLLASISLFAQDDKNKVFYLDSLHKVTNEKNYDYTRVVEDYTAKKNLYTVSEYYKSGKIRMNATSKNKNNLQLEGLRIDYYENGNKKQESNYVDNKLTGKQFSWYENNVKKSEKEIIQDTKNKTSETKTLQFWNSEGKQTVLDGNGQIEETEGEFYEKGEVKDGEKQGVWKGKSIKRNYTFTEKYKNGKLISGISTDTSNNNYPYKELMEKPEPRKGFTDFYQHIGKNFKTPDVPGLHGKIHVTFVVDKDGSLTDVRVLKDLGYNTKDEAIKAVSSYGKWTPGKMRGVPTRVLYSLPISVNNGNNMNQNR
jgi:antitoxin component YwqK of YwqJK toxin-antitoxin module